jgi:hypothetical protein
MDNVLINQQTDRIMAEFFTIAEVPADKIEMVRNWMRPVIDMALVHHHISQSALEIGNQEPKQREPWEGQEAEAIRISIEAQKKQQVYV